MHAHRKTFFSSEADELYILNIIVKSSGKKQLMQLINVRLLQILYAVWMSCNKVKYPVDGVVGKRFHRRVVSWIWQYTNGST